MFTKSGFLRRYFVMTTKHCDGFAMFNTSAQGSPGQPVYGVTGPDCPTQRDLYGEVAAAMRSKGMFVGACKGACHLLMRSVIPVRSVGARWLIGNRGCFQISARPTGTPTRSGTSPLVKDGTSSVLIKGRAQFANLLQASRRTATQTTSPQTTLPSGPRSWPSTRLSLMRYSGSERSTAAVTPTAVTATDSDGCRYSPDMYWLDAGWVGAGAQFLPLAGETELLPAALISLANAPLHPS